MIDTNKKIKPIDVSQKIRNSLPKRHFQEKSLSFMGKVQLHWPFFFVFFILFNF